MNTLEYVKRIEDTGLTRKQAETQVEVLSEAIGENMVTKQDLLEVKGGLKQDISELRQEALETKSELKQEISDLRTEILVAMEKLRYQLLLQLGGLMVALFTIAGFIMHWIFKT